MEGEGESSRRFILHRPQGDQQIPCPTFQEGTAHTVRAFGVDDPTARRLTCGEHDQWQPWLEVQDAFRAEHFTVREQEAHGRQATIAAAGPAHQVGRHVQGRTPLQSSFQRIAHERRPGGHEGLGVDLRQVGQLPCSSR